MTTIMEKTIQIHAGTTYLEGMLGIPDNAKGIVLFAHGSGSGRRSPRNQYVARVLRDHGIGTLLFDLLSENEADDRSKVFDISLLSERLQAATDWIEEEQSANDLPVGYFGASTGAAAAIQAAAANPDVAAIVSRGGRPDLAMEYLPKVSAPTLLIVGSMDLPVITMNKQAYELLTGPKELAIVPGATHLFEEPGTLEEVSRLAANWFVKYLGTGG